MKPTRIIGLGNLGCRVIEHLHQTLTIPGIELAAANTDRDGLPAGSDYPALCFGLERTRGGGAGTDAGLGRAAAEADEACLRALVSDCARIILVAGLGGGTGTGALPVLARLARESGAFVVAMVSQPYEFEGTVRNRNASAGLKELRSAADATLAFQNQNLLASLSPRVLAAEAFQPAFDQLAGAAAGLADLLTRPGILPLDIAAVERIVRGRGTVHAFAFARATGPERASEIVEKLIRHPFLQSDVLQTAERLLVHVSGGPDLALHEADAVMRGLAAHHRPGVETIAAASVRTELQGELQAAVIVCAEAIEVPDAGPGASRTPETHGESVNPFAPTSDPSPGAMPPRQPGTLRSIAADPGSLQAPGRGKASRKIRGRERHPELNLFAVSNGRFENTPATIHENENLDEPTFLRRNIVLN